MSKDDIETLSANAVENSCAKTQYLTASLRKRDKEPSWDGEIYIYNDKRKNSKSADKRNNKKKEFNKKWIIILHERFQYDRFKKLSK